MENIRANLKVAYDNYVLTNTDTNELKPWQGEERERFLQLITAEGKQTLLDVGAGTGFDSQFFEEHGLTVTAIDISTEMVKKCRELNLRALEMDLYDVHRLNESFDAVWARNSLIHIEKQEFTQVLEKIHQVLKPTGLFFMSLYGGEEWEGVLEGDIFTPPRYFSFYTDEHLRELLAPYFEVLQFDHIESKGKYHGQSLTLRKK